MPTTGEHVDAAVIGAGIVGLAIAHELKSRGLVVCVLERAGIGAGASDVDAVIGERLDPALTTLRAERFAENRLVPERQLV